MVQTTSIKNHVCSVCVQYTPSVVMLSNSDNILKRMTRPTNKDARFREFEVSASDIKIVLTGRRPELVVILEQCATNTESVTK